MRNLFLAITLLFTYIASAQKNCASTDYLHLQLKEDAGLAAKLASQEEYISKRIQSQQRTFGIEGSYIPAPAVIRIPVVVHVLYNSAAQNISDAQIHSQLKALNEDYRKKNVDISKVPEIYHHLAADCSIEFVLAKQDPSGKPTTGIVRRQTPIQVFGLDDRIKFSSLGGDDAWDSQSYLNIWTGNLAGGLIGYSSPIGGSAQKDGVVIRYDAFGTTGNLRAPFNKGRTATHEIGHWLGLFHIWGDEYCGDDKVEDTPPQHTASRGCPSVLTTSCNNNGNMFMNFMDLTNDECMNMFTAGQRKRMRAAFDPGGPRTALLESLGAVSVNGDTEHGIPSEEPSLVQTNLYPNPARDVIYLSVDSQIGTVIKVTDRLGQLQLQARVRADVHTINISTLKPGVYFISGIPGQPSVRFVKL